MTTLDEKFGIAASSQQQVITADGEVVVPHSSVTENVDNDYEASRTNLHSLLFQGQDALNHALQVAKQSDHPRAFEVVGNLIKQLAEINHQLLDVSEKRQKILEPKNEKGDQPASVTNNAIFVGTTAELSRMLTNLNNGK